MGIFELKIYYEDTDCGGVVYHANYLRYFERARTEYLAGRGISVRDYMDQGITFVVAKADIMYESPARYGDILIVTSKIEKIRKVSFFFNHIVQRKGEDAVLVRAKIKLGCLNREGKPTPLPQPVRDVLHKG